MTYVDTDRARSAAVAQAASRETIRFLFQSQVDLARRSVNTAEKGVSDAKQGRQLHREGRRRQSRADLRAAGAQPRFPAAAAAGAQAEGSTTIAFRLGQAIQTRRTELAKLAPLVTTYRDIVQQQNDAEARRNELQRDLEGLLAQARAADPESVVTVGEPEKLSRLMAFVRRWSPRLRRGAVPGHRHRVPAGADPAARRWRRQRGWGGAGAVSGHRPSASLHGARVGFLERPRGPRPCPSGREPARQSLRSKRAVGFAVSSS